MQLGQGWSHVISMHQVLLLRLRPFLCQIRLHQNEQFMQRIPADAFPSWAVDIVNSGAFITGIWAYWKDTFSVPSYDTSVADALILIDVNGNSRDTQRHFVSSPSYFFFPWEFEANNLRNERREMAAETSDDKALESIIAVLAAVAIERENATVAAAVVGAEVKEENETAVVQEEAGIDEKAISIKEETTDTSADDVITIDDSINDSNDNAIDTVEKVDHVNSLGEEYSSKQSDVVENVDGEVMGELDDTQSTEENTDLSLTSPTAVDREEPSCTSLSDLQQVDSAPSTDAIISTDQPDSETVQDTG
uniref:Uncharacterized protein n=1 Tax=Plectus sambesii TaxID=2011161 RepID=A0A914V4H6_9BILA